MPHITPFGDRILVTKKKIGEKLGNGVLFAPDTVKDRDTDLATITHIPDHSFADQALIENAKDIIKSMIEKVIAGDSHALSALLQFRTYLSIKSLKKGDDVMISKYVGVTFDDKVGGVQTLVDGDDVIGRVRYDSEPSTINNK